MKKSDLQKNYHVNFNKCTEQLAKWECAIEGLTFDKLEKRKLIIHAIMRCLWWDLGLGCA